MAVSLSLVRPDSSLDVLSSSSDSSFGSNRYPFGFASFALPLPSDSPALKDSVSLLEHSHASDMRMSTFTVERSYTHSRGSGASEVRK